MTFPEWAPSRLVRFYHDHEGFLDVKLLCELLEHPEMECFWAEFSRRCPGQEYHLYYLVQTFIDQEVKSLSDRMQEVEELREAFLDLERKLQRTLPDVHTRSGALLLAELEWVRRFKIEMDKGSLQHFSGLPDRSNKRVKLHVLVRNLDKAFQRLGYRMLARLCSVALGDDDISAQTVRDILIPKAVRKKKTNPPVVNNTPK